MRRLWALVAVTLVFVPLMPASGASDAVADAAPRTPGVPRIAVLDTGIDPAHPEFASGQIIAWRDFTSARSPTPVDTHGHGTATASLVAGLNAHNCAAGNGGQKMSFAPGAELVIARVAITGAITGDVEGAIRWAIDQDVDVISMSFGSSVPIPSFGSNAVAQARAAGILSVVSAGNSFYNPATIGYLSGDVNVLAVGGGQRNGGTLLSTTSDWDPEVTSWSDAVCVAMPGGGYAQWWGTSFSAPLVAGMAAKAMVLARDAGQPDTPAHIELLLQRSASNSPFSPYAREGLGFLLDKEWPTVEAHALAGTFPDYDAQGPHAVADRTYHEQVATRIRILQS